MRKNILVVLRIALLASLLVLATASAGCADRDDELEPEGEDDTDAADRQKDLRTGPEDTRNVERGPAPPPY